MAEQPPQVLTEQILRLRRCEARRDTDVDLVPQQRLRQPSAQAERKYAPSKPGAPLSAGSYRTSARTKRPAGRRATAKKLRAISDWEHSEPVSPVKSSRQASRRSPPHGRRPPEKNFGQPGMTYRGSDHYTLASPIPLSRPGTADLFRTYRRRVHVRVRLLDGRSMRLRRRCSLPQPPRGGCGSGTWRQDSRSRTCSGQKISGSSRRPCST